MNQDSFSRELNVVEVRHIEEIRFATVLLGVEGKHAGLEHVNRLNGRKVFLFVLCSNIELQRLFGRRIGP